jgi:hypothetical protein
MNEESFSAENRKKRIDFSTSSFPNGGYFIHVKSNTTEEIEKLSSTIKVLFL